MAASESVCAPIVGFSRTNCARKCAAKSGRSVLRSRGGQHIVPLVRQIAGADFEDTRIIVY